MGGGCKVLGGDVFLGARDPPPLSVPKRATGEGGEGGLSSGTHAPPLFRRSLALSHPDNVNRSPWYTPDALLSNKPTFTRISR